MLIFIDSYCDAYRDNTVVSVSISNGLYDIIIVVVEECEVVILPVLIDEK